MTVATAKLVGLTTLELEPEEWKAKDPKTGKWDFTGKPAVIIRRKVGDSLYKLKIDKDEIAPLVSMLTDLEI